MADNYVGKLLTELTEKTTATDTDLLPVAEKTGTLFRMTLAKLKEIFLGTKDISGIGDGTVKGAISELNTNLQTADVGAAPNSGVTIYDAFAIPEIKIAVISLVIPASYIGVKMSVCGITVTPYKVSYAALNGYSGKDGQVYVLPEERMIYCDSSSNGGDGRATLVFRYH